jgi:predicted nucleic acid-binding protein
MDNAIILDTSCLIALDNLDTLDILKSLYGNIIITPEVKEEFGKNLPEWIKINKVKDKKKQEDLETKLDKGEAASIALALELPNTILIIDELKGRKIAHSLGINIIGTIGILLLAERKGLIKDFIGTILRLVNKGFRLSDTLLDNLIKKFSHRN